RLSIFFTYDHNLLQTNDLTQLFYYVNLISLYKVI
ncbi:uncharacterized protein METZ01_LOCUS367331, partial [marine metagenome]